MQKLGDFNTASTLFDQDIVSTLDHIHAAEARYAASRFAMLAEAERRGLAMKLGHSSVKRWYGNAVRIPHSNVERQIALGTWLTRHRTVADALADGTIHALHAKAIYDGIDTIATADPTLADDAIAHDIAELLHLAANAIARAVTDRAQELAHRHAADARARHDAEQQRARDTAPDPEPAPEDNDADTDTDDGPAARKPDIPPPAPPPAPPRSVAENTDLNKLVIFPQPNGRSRIEGDFDTLTTEKLRSCLSPLSAPRPLPDGTLDPRSPAKRTADALGELLTRYLAGNKATNGGGAHVGLLINLSDLMRKPKGAPGSGTGSPPSSERNRGRPPSAPSGPHVPGSAGWPNSPGNPPGPRGAGSFGNPNGPVVPGSPASPGGPECCTGTGYGPGRMSGTGADGCLPGPGDPPGPRGPGGFGNPNSPVVPGSAGCPDGPGNPPGPRGAGSFGNPNGPGTAGWPDSPGSAADCSGAVGDPAAASGSNGVGSAGHAGDHGSSVDPDDPEWPFRLDWTGPISRHLAEYLSCDANLTPVIVDDAGAPLVLGRTVRLATPEQRVAITIRDRCCVMCGRPAAWCEIHHLVYWEDGGTTDIDNLALVCGECHRLIHHTDWQLVMGPDRHPYAIPPATTDPEQRPVPSYHRRRKHTA